MSLAYLFIWLAGGYMFSAC